MAGRAGRQVFRGGGTQVLIVAPWRLGAASWPRTAAPLPPGRPWELLGYDPTPCSAAAFLGDAAALRPLLAADPAAASEPSPRFGLTPLHHACVGASRDAVAALLAVKADPMQASAPDGDRDSPTPVYIPHARTEVRV